MFSRLLKKIPHKKMRKTYRELLKNSCAVGNHSFGDIIYYSTLPIDKRELLTELQYLFCKKKKKLYPTGFLLLKESIIPDNKLAFTIISNAWGDVVEFLKSMESYAAYEKYEDIIFHQFLLLFASRSCNITKTKLPYWTYLYAKNARIIKYQNSDRAQFHYDVLKKEEIKVEFNFYENYSFRLPKIGKIKLIIKRLLSVKGKHLFIAMLNAGIWEPIYSFGWLKERIALYKYLNI